ncbi:MAG: tripartite tricarboxylate transporter permease, partial [Candidatus Competibacteraceae bacterium]|nr:tripartite tricarboxylate transporter permease [Candidatus Competibacteraceae bacterium]
MELISSADLYQALSVVLMPAVLLWITGGVVLGMIVGATPGLTATAGVAIATPLTFSMDFQSAMALLLGIYCGGYFAGSIPAILINTPGAPGNAATAMAGYPLARRGQANLALGLAVISSVIGGWLSALCLLLAAPGLASIALKFTSAEYFALGLFGLTCVAAIAGGSLLKGITAALLGMVLGCVGIDPVSGTERLTFALPDLLGGVPLVPALIAFFAITELISKGVQNSADDIVATQDQVRLSALLPYYIRHKWLVLKSAAIGTGIGMLPGTGPTIAAWIAYGEALRSEKKAAKHEPDNPQSEHAESGSVPGVIAAETANNAVTGGALIPMLTLGIPGDTVTAVLIGALLIQGIEPGPFFIRTET